MFKNRSLLFVLIILTLGGISLLSCDTTRNTATVILNTANIVQKEVEITNIEKGISQRVVGKKTDTLFVKIDEEIILDFKHGIYHSYVHLKPGETIILDTIASGPILIGQINNPSIENRYLFEFDSIYNSEVVLISSRFLAKEEANKYKFLIDRKFTSLDKLISRIDEDNYVSDEFKKMVTDRFLCLKANELLKYVEFYRGWHEIYPKIPEGYYAEVSKIDLLHPRVLTFEEGRKLGEKWIEKDLIYKNFDSKYSYQEFLSQTIKNAYGQSLLRSYCEYKLIYNQLSKGMVIDSTLELINDFKQTNTNKYLENELERTIAPWMVLRSKQKAPEFEANDLEGKPIQLSNMRGENLYVNVWSTTCVPCIKEKPHLKKLQEAMVDQDIKFVSVSIDSEDDQKMWRRFIKKMEMKGLQLIAIGDWDSEIATAYHIESLPRFLLIDKDGYILSSNAPRPSDPKIMEYLKENL